MRDIIYEYALVEPSLWDKRHDRSCPYHDPLMPFEPPVFTVNPVTPNEDRLSDPTLLAENERSAACWRLCRRRKGLGLLAVSRSAAHEAGPVFWSTNVFCFSYRDKFLDAMKTVPASVQAKINRISVIEYGGRHQRLLSDKEEGAILLALRSLTNLTHLELPPEYLSYSLEKLLRFSSPSALWIGMLSLVHIPTANGGLVPLWLKQWLSVPLPKCSLGGHRHRCVSIALEGLCFDCYMEGWETQKSIRSWNNDYEFAHKPVGTVQQCQRLATQYLARGIPAYRPEAPHVIKIEIRDGTNHRVEVLGLPVVDDKQRELLLNQRCQVMRKLSGWPRSQVAHYARGAFREGMWRSNMQGERPGVVETMSLPVTTALPAEAEPASKKDLEKEKRKEVNGRHEARRLKSARKKDRKALQSSVKETQEERSFARKRAGRRTD